MLILQQLQLLLNKIEKDSSISIKEFLNKEEVDNKTINEVVYLAKVLLDDKRNIDTLCDFGYVTVITNDFKYIKTIRGSIIIS